MLLKREQKLQRNISARETRGSGSLSKNKTFFYFAFFLWRAENP
jgi:hypothetical protein